MALSSHTKPPCRSAGSSLWSDSLGDSTFQRATLVNFLCEKLAAVIAFLRVHFLSSQRMLLFYRKRKEPVVTGCVGRELSGIFCMPQSQLWELGMWLRFPGLGQAWDRYHCSSWESQFRNAVSQEVGRQK